MGGGENDASNSSGDESVVIEKPACAPTHLNRPVAGGGSLMVAWRLHRKRVLVVGGGAVAASRVFSALDADGIVHVVAPREGVHPQLMSRIEHREVEWSDRVFQESDLDEGYDMVLSTIDDHDVSRGIALECRARKIPVNCADIPDLCDFWYMSTHRDGPLQIGICSNGHGPRLGVRLRRHIQATLPPHSGKAVEKMGLLRKKVRNTDPANTQQASSRRMGWLSEVCNNWPLAVLAEMDEKQMDSLIEQYKDAPRVCPVPNGTEGRGKLYLIGAGPGDPDLLTVKAARLLREADLVVSDRLVGSEITSISTKELKIARKFQGEADKAQEELHQWCLEGLQQGKTVVRLKSGDPFVFGRGGEEVLFFRQYGYEAEVIPGVSSCTAAPTLAHIPVTHRNTANQVLIVTGRDRHGTIPSLPGYEASRTVVFLMAVHRLRLITDRLLELEYPPSTPTAIVERASCTDQRVLQARLDEIATMAETSTILPPATFVVGSVVDALNERHLHTKFETNSSSNRARKAILEPATNASAIVA